MKIAVLSGKGGTGKTFISVNLCSVMNHGVYVDCDVEEPNGNLFFKPHIEQETTINVLIPSFDQEKCTGCKACVDFCAFHALAFVQKKPMLFPEVCHSCGGCSVVCREGAVNEVKRPVGVMQVGRSGDVQVISGTMSMGEVSGIPIIRSLLEAIPKERDVVVDCPPGSACMVMESIQDADYCILVAEPTEYGRHNLQMVYELTQVFHKKTGVILNKCFGEENPSEAFCNDHQIEILGRIPFDPVIGRANSEGQIVVQANPQAKALFEGMLQELRKKVSA